MNRLGDFVQMTFGHAFKSAEFSEDTRDIRLLRGDNIGQGRLRWHQAKRFPAARLSEVDRYELKHGDVVLAMDRPWISAGLKFAVVREDDLPSLLVQRVARLRAVHGLDQGYLGYVIASRAFTDYVVGVQTGSAVPHISGGQIADFPLGDLPPVEVQRAVAATLGALDDKIESNRRAVSLSLELLDAMAAAQAQHLSLVELSVLVELNRKSVSMTQLGNDTVLHFSLPAFDDGRQPERTTASGIKSNKLLIESETILVSRLNPRFNRTWWIHPDTENVALASPEFAALLGKEGLDLAALWLAVRSSAFREELPARVTGTSGSHQRVRPADLLTIPVPDVRAVSPAIVGVSRAVFEKAHSLSKEIRQLIALRDALLPELMSGRIRVPEARDAVVEMVRESEVA